MRFFSKAAAVTAAAGIAVIGTIAAGGGVAHAATHQSATGCTTNGGLLSVGAIPSCSANDSTVVNPTSLTVNITGNFLSVLGTILPGLGEKVTFTLSCSVNGNLVQTPESFTSTSPTDTTEPVDLQSAVGSSVPNYCTIQDMTATSTLALTLLALQPFTFGASVTANTGISGAIYMNNGSTAKGAGASTCVDDANNGNAGSKVQAYQCNSDLAQYWIQSNGGQIVRNGVCLTQNGTKATLAKCSATNKAQQWTVNGTGGHFATFVNKSTSQCLTAASPKNFSQITVSKCSGGATQKWAGPAKSPA